MFFKKNEIGSDALHALDTALALGANLLSKESVCKALLYAEGMIYHAIRIVWLADDDYANLLRGWHIHSRYPLLRFPPDTAIQVEGSCKWQDDDTFGLE